MRVGKFKIDGITDKEERVQSANANNKFCGRERESGGERERERAGGRERKREKRRERERERKSNKMWRSTRRESKIKRQR